MDGVIPVRKPAGLTSRQVVDRVRRILDVRKAGHSGTLDPGAEGVLPICLGRATRLADYLHHVVKTYEVELIIGASTDTQDTYGVTTCTADASRVNHSLLAACFQQFIGVIEQIPPMHSACKHQGRRLYTLARSGVTVARIPRKVHITSIELLRFEPGVTAHAWLRVMCGSGVYMRTLCEDIAACLDMPGHMGALLRTRAGGIDIGECTDLDSLDPSKRLNMAEAVMRCMPAVTMENQAIRMLESGLRPRDIQIVPVSGDWRQAEQFAVLRPGGSLCAIVSVEDGRLQPHCVFPEVRE